VQGAEWIPWTLGALTTTLIRQTNNIARTCAVQSSRSTHSSVYPHTLRSVVVVVVVVVGALSLIPARPLVVAEHSSSSSSGEVSAARTSAAAAAAASATCAHRIEETHTASSIGGQRVMETRMHTCVRVQ